MQHSILAVRAPSDLLLHHLAPLGLAAARGTALVVDLDPDAPNYPGELTIAGLIRDGVRREHLAPAGPGVAVLGNGGADRGEALELVGSLARGWPAVVVRSPGDLPVPTIPVHPAFPAGWGWDEPVDRVVRQVVVPLGRRLREGELPRLRRSQVTAMLQGRVRTSWRWVAAWRPVWGMPWA